MSNKIYGTPVGSGATPIVKFITESYHIAELDVGVYFVRTTDLLDNGEPNSIVILNDENGTKQELINGFLMVYDKQVNTTDDATQCSLFVHYIGVCNNTEYVDINGESLGNTLSSSSEFSGAVRCVKYVEDTDVYMASVWYGLEKSNDFTNITTEALKFDLNADADHCHIPSTKAVVDYVDTVIGGIENGSY